MLLSVVLPAYKEADNLEKILPQIKAVLNETAEECEIIVVDTLEKMDDTDAICSKNNVKYVQRKGGNSYGDAIRTGIKEAQGNYLVVMDADGSHNPRDILKFLEVMKKKSCDLVIGPRYAKGGHTENSIILVAMSWVLNLSYRVLFGIKVKDVSDSYRLYRTEQLKSLNLVCQNFDIVEEILIKLYRLKSPYVVEEVPIVFHKRDQGQSKRNLMKFIATYLQTMYRLKKL